MVRSKLDDVVLCPLLPSLPVVAAEVIELTSDPNISMKRIAQCVQKDQALAGKVLKTVNSSYYALASPCSSIERAMAFLGMNTVKSLVLGFSLVDMTGQSCSGGFNLMAHWRRAIVGAVSSRRVATLTESADPDEAFMAALFQDVGALACHMALGDEYDAVIAGCDHADWPEAERAAFGFTHAQVGAELARKWKLPSAIRAAIRGHHKPDSAEREHQNLVRVVSLGSLVGSVLAQETPIPTADQIQRHSRVWFQENAPDANDLIEQAAADARVLAKLFSQEIGPLIDPRELMAVAREKGIEHQIALQREAESLRREATTDALTGIANRRSFDVALERAFADFMAGEGPMAVIFCDADRFKSINDTHGHAAGDAILIELARRVSEAVGDAGLTARYGGEEIAIVLPGIGIDRAAILGEQVRDAVACEPFDLAAVDCGIDLISVTISAGVAATDGEKPGHYDFPQRLLQDADACVYEAKGAGRNRVMVHTPESSREAASAEGNPGSPGAIRVVFVEDDPLAATLITTLLKRQKDVEIQWIESGTRARAEIARMAGGETTPADVFLVDLNLPGVSGYELLRIVRASDKLKSRPFLVLSGEDEATARAECLRLGATGFIPKQEFVVDIGKWVGMILDGSRRAA